jgi:hypothetical protein
MNRLQRITSIDEYDCTIIVERYRNVYASYLDRHDIFIGAGDEIQNKRFTKWRLPVEVDMTYADRGDTIFVEFVSLQIELHI